MTQGASILTSGERAIFCVRGGSRDAAGGVLASIVADDALAEFLVPSPAPVRAGNDDFGSSVLVQEFIVAAAAGLSVEALVAGVRAVFSQRDEPAAPGAVAPPRTKHISVTARPAAEGLIEVTVTIESSDDG
jgi:hypothetical protein